MSVVGTLELQILTDLARLKTDLSSAKGQINRFGSEVGKVASLARTALGSIGIGLSVGAFVGFINHAIEAKERLFDLSTQTGISVNALGSLAQVALLSNTSLDKVASGSAKLSKAMVTTNEDSKGAAQGIAALGLDFDKFKKLGADQQLLAVAKAMDGFRDGTGKTATAMLLFGKAGAELLPFLKELAERGLVASKQTTESAKAAKEFADNMIILKGAGEGFGLTLANFVLPWVVKLTREMMEAKKAFGSYWAALLPRADTGLPGFQNLDKALSDTIERYKELDTQRERFAAREKAGDPSGTSTMQLQRIKREQDGLDQRINFLRALQADGGAGAGRGFKSALDKDKPELDVWIPGEKVKDQYADIVAAIDAKIGAQQLELQTQRALTDAEQESLRVLELLRSGKSNTTQEENRIIGARLERLLVEGKVVEAQREQIKWSAEVERQQRQALDTQAAAVRSAQEEAAALQQQVEQYGLTREELERLTSARLRDAAAQLRWKAQFNGNTEFLEAQAQLYRDQADALDRAADRRDVLAAKDAKERTDPMAGARRAVKDYMKDIEAAGDATYRYVGDAMRSLEDQLTAVFKGGTFNARAFVDTLIAEFMRLAIIRPLLNSIFGFFGDLLGAGGGPVTSNFSTAAGISGGRAGGGSVAAGNTYLVGERGPELLHMGGDSGSITPNGKLGGVSITMAPIIKIDARSDQAQVAVLVRGALDQNNKALFAELRAQGVM